MVPTLYVMIEEKSGRPVATDWRYSGNGKMPLDYELKRSRSLDCDILSFPYDNFLLFNVAKVTAELGIEWACNYPFYSPAVVGL